MNRVRNVWKWVLIALLVAGLLPALGGVAAAGSGAGWLSLWSNTSLTSCDYTLTAQWSNVSGAKSIEMWLEQNGTRIAPTHVEAVKGRNGTVTYTFPTLAPSAALNIFQGWAQLRDGNGTPIPGTLDFTGRGGLYCTAP